MSLDGNAVDWEGKPSLKETRKLLPYSSFAFDSISTDTYFNESCLSYKSQPESQSLVGLFWKIDFDQEKAQNNS